MRCQWCGCEAPSVRVPHADAMDGARTVNKWARQAGIGRKSLVAKCYAATGYTPHELLRLARVLQILDYMQEHTCSVGKAARVHGIDQFSFSNMCLRALGARPSALRFANLREVVRSRYPERRAA